MEYLKITQHHPVSVCYTNITEEDDLVTCTVEQVGELAELDYVEGNKLVSNRLKEVLDLFLPDTKWRMYVFFGADHKSSAVFWQLPSIRFTLQKEGSLLSLAMVECALRRGIGEYRIEKVTKIV